MLSEILSEWAMVSDQNHLGWLRLFGFAPLALEGSFTQLVSCGSGLATLTTVSENLQKKELVGDSPKSKRRRTVGI